MDPTTQPPIKPDTRPAPGSQPDGPTPVPPDLQQPPIVDEKQKESERAAVQMWTKRITSAKSKREKDFKRIRDNMNFAAGLQWPGQKTMTTDKYVCNLVNDAVNSKTSSLYARNPTAEYQRRKRLDFQLWDGHLESLIPLIQMAGSHPMGVAALPVEAKALLADYSNGEQLRQMIDKVGKTLEILFQYFMDEQDAEDGEFKLQAKQLVRRVITCCVGFGRVSFSRDELTMITSSGVNGNTGNKMSMAKAMLEKLDKGDLTETSPHYQTLMSLLTSMGMHAQDEMVTPDISEKLIFDLSIPPTSIVVEPRCRTLKGFIGAKWVVQEYILPIEDVNAMFEVDVKISGGTKQYTTGGKEKSGAESEGKSKDEGELCMLWEVLDKKTKSHFYIVDGHKDYILAPEPLEPSVKGFWPIVALTFNDVETEESADASIYPPSDVQLMFSAQKEWNRSRDELKKHRRANAPGYITNKGMLTENDKVALENQVANQVVDCQT